MQRLSFVQHVENSHPGLQLGKTLQGIVVDWSEQQLNGLEVGKETTEKVIKKLPSLFHLKNFYISLPHTSISSTSMTSLLDHAKE